MFCRNCGRQISDGASFCPGCGAQVAPFEEEGSADQLPSVDPAGSTAAAVSTAHTRRAKKRRYARIAIIFVVVTVVVLAAVAIAIAPHLGSSGTESDDVLESSSSNQEAVELVDPSLSSSGVEEGDDVEDGNGVEDENVLEDGGEQENIAYPEALELAQMSGEEAGKVLSGLNKFDTDSKGHCCYATSEELAELGKLGLFDIRTLESLKEFGGSFIWAYQGNGAIDRTTAENVARGAKLAGITQVRAADKMPDLETLKDIVKGLGVEHMVVFDYDYIGYPALEAFCTIGDDICAEIVYFYPKGTINPLVRQDFVRYRQDMVSAILKAVQAGASQGTDGVSNELNSSNPVGDIPHNIDSSNILYYE